jgi:hypothetical protein
MATQKMKSDFIESVTKPLVEGGGCERAVNRACMLIDTLFIKRHARREHIIDQEATERCVPLSMMMPNPEKHSPTFTMSVVGKATALDIRARVISKPRTSWQTKEFIELFWNDHNMRSIWEDYPEKVSQLLVGTPTMPVPNWGYYSYHPGFCVGGKLPAGTIGFIMEGGWKNRAVASPFLAYQALSEPLKIKLYDLCREDPAVYTEDQSQAHEVITSWLADPNQGKVYSFDASAFTDRFPYRIQRRLLEMLLRNGEVEEFDIRVIDHVVSSSWKLPGSDTHVKYEVGQPMGLGPSFHLACLTHSYLVRSLAKELGIRHPQNYYCVVGDDVVIRHSGLADAYHKLLTGCGVVINMQKSIVSDTYAEFCGKIISKFGVTPSMKVRLIRDPDQLIRVLEFYGKAAMPFLSPKERRWAVKAFLPDFLGGLGFTPEGMTYKEYLSTLNIGKIQENFLRQDILNIYKPVTGATRQQNMENTQEFLSKCMLSNVYYRRWCSENGLIQSELSGLPVSQEPAIYDRSDLVFTPGSSPSVIELSLQAQLKTLLEEYGHPNSVPISKLTDIIEISLNKFGYIRPEISRIVFDDPLSAQIHFSGDVISPGQFSQGGMNESNSITTKPGNKYRTERVVKRFSSEAGIFEAKGRWPESIVDEIAAIYGSKGSKAQKKTQTREENSLK